MNDRFLTSFLRTVISSQFRLGLIFRVSFQILPQAGRTGIIPWRIFIIPMGKVRKMPRISHPQSSLTMLIQFCLAKLLKKVLLN